MGNRRRKKLNPKYAALPWNIHNEKRVIAEEEEVLATIYEELLGIKQVIEERKKQAEILRQKQHARMKLEEDNRKALDAAAKMKREEEMKALATEADRQRQAEATKAKATTGKRSIKAKKPVVTMSSEANETPKPKRKYTRKTKSVK